MKSICRLALSILIGLAFPLASFAELHYRGGGLIYDDVLDVTWLQNVTLAAGTVYDDDDPADKLETVPGYNVHADGLLSYPAATAWVEALEYYDPVRNVIWDDWRLPQVQPVNGSNFNLVPASDGSIDVGTNITSPLHELAYMYYVNLRNVAPYDALGTPQTEYGLVDDPADPNDESLFVNLKTGIYWYSTIRPDNDTNAWDFRMQNGNTTAGHFGYVRHAWAVRDGDVAIHVSGMTASPSMILDTETSQLSVAARDLVGGPQALSHQWTVVSGGGLLDDATSATPVYIPADIVGSQAVKLKVAISNGDSTVSRTVTVQVNDASGPPIGVEVLNEDFSSGVLAGWSIHDQGTVSAPSAWRILSNKQLAQQSNISDSSTTADLPKLGTYLLYDGGTGWSDYRLQFTLRSSDDDTLGVMFRVQDSDNYYRFSWDRQRSQRRLVKNEGGVFTLLASDTVRYTLSQIYQVEIVAQGGVLEVWIDGVRVFQVNDAAHAQGSFAFYTWQNNGAFFDNVVVQDLGVGSSNVSPTIASVTASPAAILDTQTSQLSVVASDMDGPQALSYQWMVVSGGGSLSDAGSATPIYTPADVTGTQAVTVQVSVSDGAASASQTLTLQVQDANAPPPNGVPQITGVTAVPSTILDNKTSQLSVVASDADGPQAMSYQWTLVSGVGSLSDAGSATPVYIPADVSGTQTVTLQVAVSDGASTVTQTLSLQVRDADAPPPSTQRYTYDFVWYSGAQQTWVYEAAPKMLVDVYEDASTPENDVFIEFRNILDTPLGADSSIVELQVDTGTDAPSMFSGLPIWGYKGTNSLYQYPVGDPTTLLDLSAGRITWTGEYAFGGISGTGPMSAGVNPGESLILKATLANGVDFTQVINAIASGLSSTYVPDGHFGEWTTTERDSYRAGATHGLRFAILVHGVVPNSWHPDGHGLFVTRGLVNVGDVNAPQINVVTATPNSILDNQTSQLAVVASDPDNGPQALSYQWGVASGGGALSAPNSATPIYTPADVTGIQAVTLLVEVSDGASTVSQTVKLHVQDADAPQISAVTASPASILDNETSQLSVVASDPDNGPQALSYQWTLVSGVGSLSDAGSATPVYIPADVSGTQTVTLQVAVSDGASTVTQTLTLQVQDAAPPGAELLNEDFSSGSLAGWSVHDEGTLLGPSRWLILSNKQLAQQSNIHDGTTDLSRRGTYLLYDGGASWTDYRLKFTLRSSDDDTLGVMFRVQDSDDFYRFSWDRQRSYRSLVKSVNGVFSELASDTVRYTLSQIYQVEIVAQGGVLEVWIDGVRVFQVNDAAHAQGSFAFYTWQNNGAFFDNVQVNELP